MQVIKISAILVVLILLLGCASDTSELEKDMQANGKDIAIAKATIQQQAGMITTLQSQVTQLQKQVAVSENRSGTYATRDELARALGALTVSITQAQILSRLAAVEGQVAVLTANFANYRVEVNNQLAGMRVTIDQLAAMFQGSSPALAQLEALRQQVVALQAKFAEHGW